MLAWLERNQFLALAVAGLLVLCGLLIAELRSEAPPALVIEQPRPPDGPVVVHVAGAVVRPAVYELGPGARVQDAITAAGGPTTAADVNGLNLARYVRDGERIVVPGASSQVAAAVPAAAGGLIDLNTATQSQLMALEGIGEAYSRRIIDSRVVDGPYRSVDDLRTRNVLPASTFEKVRHLVTVSAP